MKKNWFKTTNKGFSLVELIVVIAIMAILVGVAVPVYGSYIEKTQKTKDEQLVGEIVHAIEIAAAGDNWYKEMPNGGAVGAVVLTPSGANITGNAALLEKALKDTFGDEYASKLKLSYDGWNIEYKDSSFSGKEAALLVKVDTLTDILGDVITEVAGDSFVAFLGDLKISMDDKNAAADAAVLYVAQQTGGLSEQAKQGFVDFIAGLPDSGISDAAGITEKLVPMFDGSYVAAAAALYATAEGYCQYESSLGNDKPLNILNEATQNIDVTNIDKENQDKAVKEVFNAFAKVQQEVLGPNEDQYNFYKYFSSGQAATNTKAYLDIMSTVTGAQNEVVGSGTLGQDNFFSSEFVSNLFVAYSQGGVIILVEMDEKGTVVIDNPLV